jgi:hypothetical protein
MKCIHCESTKLRNKGYATVASQDVRRYQCMDCGRYNNFKLDDIVVEKQQPEPQEPPAPKVKQIEPEITELGDYAGIVVTSVLNDTTIFKEFFENLKAYCNHHNYKLMVIRNKYMNPSIMNNQDGVSWPSDCIPYFLDTTFRYKDKFKIIGDCNIIATASHPLTGIDGLSEGITTIVGHPVLQMQTMPVNKHKDHVILHSTGSVSVKTGYSATKTGYRASFHHCYGALVVQLDKDNGKFHLRQLLADKTGAFHDLDQKWENCNYTKSSVDAIYLGDEHVIFRDEKVSTATFGENGIVQTLRPTYIIRGDALDCHSISHHHTNDFFAKYKKTNVTNLANIESELKETVSYINKTTPDFATSLLVNGNHESHLDKWLNVADPKQDLINAKFYHRLMWLKLHSIESGDAQSAFSLYIDSFGLGKENVKICPDGFSLHGINLSMHGDIGPNGARGSIKNIAKIGERSVVGHSHVCSILMGTFQVGTSSKLQLEYNHGPSSWMHAHCVVHKNGKRQMIFIIDGDWRKV